MKSKTIFSTFSESTNRTWFGFGMMVLRVVLGFQFLLAGLAKFGGWSASGYLGAATGPFAGFFQSLAGLTLIDQLNIWGLTLIGLALILGLMVRPASFAGALMMILYYFAQFEQNTAHGFINEHIIYILIFIIFMAGGVGHIFGLDGLISGNLRRKKKKFQTLFFG